MAKLNKDGAASQADHGGVAADADTDTERQQTNEQPSENTTHATDIPQSPAAPDTGATAGPTSGSNKDPADEPVDTAAIGDEPPSLTESVTAAEATDGIGPDTSAEPSMLVADDTVLIHFTGPWKNYSRGDVTRLAADEVLRVIDKGLAELGEG
ncbi:RodZ family helix-turn-helix domain-containing protein [Aeromonas jandaei]|uniref:hypothetical protein n=1 Tax=Aeromonas jandaei TaxID=650 RepID=UPI0039889081